MKNEEFSTKFRKKRMILLNDLFKMIDEAVIFTNIDGKVIFCTDRCKQVLGLDKKEFLNKNIYDYFNDKKAKSRNVTSSDVVLEGKTLLHNKLLHIKLIPFISSDRITGNIVVIKDISEKAELENKLKKTETTLGILEELLDTAYHGMVIVDEDGYITKCKYEKLLGIKEEEAIGKHVTDVIENTRMHIVAKTGERELEDVQQVQGHDLIASRIPIKKDGKVIGAVGTVHFKDIKELKYLAKRLEKLESKITHYKGEIKRIQQARYSFDNIVTQNTKMKHLKNIARRASESNSTILIQGESGTGKEFFAHAIHKASLRKYGAFVRVNCAAIPKDLLESELFGYEQGAFTGAKKGGKIGKFELANGGTILLDEIGSMPLNMQVKLLRVLEEREIERVGGNNKIDLDVRVISSTNENLEKKIKKGKFRRDLYYRLNVIRLHIPPLRDRMDDIKILSENILGKLVNELGIDRKKLLPETINKLHEYSWPGNVRELRNVIERAINIATGEVITPEDLPEYVLNDTNTIKHHDKDTKVALLKKVVADAEIKAIKNAIKQCNGNRTLAAKKLGIHRTALYKKIDKYGLDISIL